MVLFGNFNFLTDERVIAKITKGEYLKSNELNFYHKYFVDQAHFDKQIGELMKAQDDPEFQNVS